ncbi:MAG: nucleotide-binding protein [Actinobacteria bacterium]|nr:nucleotide-binding protein [Actinomycetota bacterium]
MLGTKGCSPENFQIEYDPFKFFVGYQINSNYYNQTNLLSMCQRVSDLINNDLKKQGNKVRLLEFGYEEGIHIGCEVCELIQKSICCIFEISDLNPNVMIEIGKSLYKNIILLRSAKSTRPPTDISGVKYIEYDDEQELNSLASKIAKYILDEISKYILENKYNFNEFFLKNEINKILKSNIHIGDNFSWQDLLSSYDENKLRKSEEYTLIGIAKYKKIKQQNIEDEIDSELILDAEKYFLKSMDKDKSITENYFYLYLLDLIKLDISPINGYRKIFLDSNEREKEFKKAILRFEEVSELLITLSHKDLNNFLFLNSQKIVEHLIQRELIKILQTM